MRPPISFPCKTILISTATCFEALTVEALRELSAAKDAKIAALQAEKDQQVAELRGEIAELKQALQAIHTQIEPLQPLKVAP